MELGSTIKSQFLYDKKKFAQETWRWSQYQSNPKDVSYESFFASQHLLLQQKTNMNKALVCVVLLVVLLACQISYSEEKPINPIEPKKCRILQCFAPCKYGYKKDWRGCSTCGCCPKPICDRIRCKYGVEYKVSRKTGCRICKCKTHRHH